MKLSFDDTALLVLDMQADFYAPHGAASLKGRQVTNMQSVASRISIFANNMADRGMLVIFTKFISSPGITPVNLELVAKVNSYKISCQKGSGGDEFYGVDVPNRTIIIEKPHYDAFAYTNLNKILQEKTIKNILIAGVRTEVCVDATAKRAAAEGYFTYILSDLTETYDNKTDVKDRLLKFFGVYYGQVSKSDDILKIFK